MNELAVTIILTITAVSNVALWGFVLGFYSHYKTYGKVAECKDCTWAEDCGKGNYLCHNQMIGITPKFYCAGFERRKRR